MLAAVLLLAAAAHGQWSDADTRPQNDFSFVSPLVSYYPPDAWWTNLVNARANTAGNASVSISTVASGMTFKVSASPVTLLVNGSSPEAFNATVAINERNATVEGLQYGFHNFTLITNGTGRFHGATADVRGSKWLPAQPPQVDRFNTTPNALRSTSGTWSTNMASTNASGGKLTIHPPANTALLQVTELVDSPPGGDFNVSINPAPPFGPPSQAVTWSLRKNETDSMTGVVNAVLFRAALDPGVQYTVDMVYAGNGSYAFAPFEIMVYGGNGSVPVPGAPGSAPALGLGMPALAIAALHVLVW